LFVSVAVEIDAHEKQNELSDKYSLGCAEMKVEHAKKKL
jgi:hypothetical protein